MKSEEQADVTAVLLRETPRRCLLAAKRQSDIGNDARHPKLTLLRVRRAHILEASACLPPACERDALGGRQQPVAADYCRGIANQPGGYISGIADDGRDEYDLGLRSERHSSEVSKSS